LLFGIAHADPEADEHARGDQEAVGGQVEAADVEESGKHVGLDAPVKG